MSAQRLAKSSLPIPAAVQEQREGRLSAVNSLGDGFLDGAASPARMLQERLLDVIEPARPADEKWAPRKTIAVAVGASAALWALIGLTVRLMAG